MARAHINDVAFDPAEVLADFTAVNVSSGAIFSFTGQVRSTASDGTRLVALTLEGYGLMTLSSVLDFIAEARERFALDDALAIHRVGRILPGEAIVFVATAAAHRRAAFDAADWLMDQLKSRAMLWKREEHADGTVAWIEPTAADRDALARWEAS